jgi:TRAP-type mannitol/chloroaromatic compound transport system permease large subunit
MFLGLDGVEIGLIIVFFCLFAGILTGFPVAFAIAGSAIIAFGLIAAMDSAGWLVHQAIDTSSDAYHALTASGIRPDHISIFSYPDLPRVGVPVFPDGWEVALDRNLGFIVNRINERVLAGASIETLLAVLMFVMMGIALERSRIADDLLTTMARVFGPIPGGLAVSIVVVGAFLAASTGIVGATVVTMGLIALPTMLRYGYSKELSTGVIAASGTLGQIIPPSVIIVLLGTLAGDIYSTAQEDRAQLAGCTDALTYLGEPAVLSVGTLFQAAFLPGILLAVLYGVYAFGFALLNPTKAPAVTIAGGGGTATTRGEKLTWFLAVPLVLFGAFAASEWAGLAGSQNVTVDSYSQGGQGASLRTDVSPDCAESMIALHGQAAWDTAVAEQEAITAAGGVEAARLLTDEERATLRAERVAAAAPIGNGVTWAALALALVLVVARGVHPMGSPVPLLIGGLGIVGLLVADILFIGPLTSPGVTTLILLIPALVALWGCRHAAVYLSRSDILRVVFPPLVLIVAVLGSIMGGITNPTPAAALGAAGALMLAAYRKLSDQKRSGRIILQGAVATVIMLLIGGNFDLRLNEFATLETWLAVTVAFGAFLYAMFALFYAAWVLFASGVLKPIVRETAKVTAMVFAILIGSQLFNLVLISFGGEHYIQDFLRSFQEEWTVFLLVMLILFLLGFVLDFLEIIYIVIPIVGPVIYGGTLDPAWVTIMIAVNLQTSFLTPPFGFALFYLRGVAPKEVTTAHIYRGIIPFVLLQIAMLLILAFFPGIITIVPDLLR